MQSETTLYFMWVTLNLTGKKKKKRRRRGQPCEEILQHERLLRVLTFSWGASKDFFSLTFGLLPFESDKTQVSSPARALWVLDADYNVKYLCGNIIMVQTYCQWQQGIRVSLFVPQDETVFLKSAPEAPSTASWLKWRPRVRADSGGISVTLSVPETMTGGWIKWEERTFVFILDFMSKVMVVHFKCCRRRQGNATWTETL